MQSGNLYVYGVSNPVAYVDQNGQIAIELTTAFLAALAAGTAIAALPYLWEIGVDFGKALAAFAEEFGAEIYTISKKAANALAKAAQKTAVAASASPTPPDPNDKNNNKNQSKQNFKKYDAKQIERKYNLKEGQYHQKIKKQILRDIRNDPRYEALFKRLGQNPDIYLSADGQIQIVSTAPGTKGQSFITELNIKFYLR